MIHKVHEHILEELKTNTRTDIVFVLTAIILNLVTLAINSAIAASNETALIVMGIFVALIVVVNLVVEIGLIKGKQTRTKLITGLLAMYEDHEVAQYYDASLLSSYQVRYNLFMLAVLFTGIVAIVIPFVLIG